MPVGERQFARGKLSFETGIDVLRSIAALPAQQILLVTVDEQRQESTEIQSRQRSDHVQFGIEFIDQFRLSLERLCHR